MALSPKAQAKFDIADQFRNDLMKFMEDNAKSRQLDAADVLYAMTTVLAMTAYVNYGANRAKARDAIGEGLDSVFTIIDEGVQKQPAVHSLVQKMAAARDRGDMVTVDRMIAEAAGVIAKAKEKP